MRCEGVLYGVAGIVVLLIIWAVVTTDVQDNSAHYLGFEEEDQSKAMEEESAPAPAPAQTKCGDATLCEPGYYVFRIRSGAANTIGPKICFNGKIFMNQALNNVGKGLNIVVVNGKTGELENARVLDGSTEETVAFLKDIKPEMIILVATYDNANDVPTEVRDIFAEMGSAKIKSLNHRDNWVFAVRTGQESLVHFEKISLFDETNNLYYGYPETAEVDGCFEIIGGQEKLDDAPEKVI